MTLRKQESNQKHIRVAAIHFLNPAPLMWDFEHPPHAAELAQRYTLHYTQPSPSAPPNFLAARALRSRPHPHRLPSLQTSHRARLHRSTSPLDQVRNIQLIVKEPDIPSKPSAP